MFLQKARFEKGKELLEAEFRSLLTRYSKPVPPILILDTISVDEDMELQEEVVLEHLPEAVLQDIICISGWLVEYGRNQGTAVGSVLTAPALKGSGRCVKCKRQQQSAAIHKSDHSYFTSSETANVKDIQHQPVI